MHLYSQTKCIFKYKCMHVYARGSGMSQRMDELSNEPSFREMFLTAELLAKTLQIAELSKR